MKKEIKYNIKLGGADYEKIIQLNRSVQLGNILYTLLCCIMIVGIALHMSTHKERTQQLKEIENLNLLKKVLKIQADTIDELSDKLKKHGINNEKS